MTDRIVDRKNDRKKKSEVREVTKKGLCTVFLKFCNKMYDNSVSSVVQVSQVIRNVILSKYRLIFSIFLQFNFNFRLAEF